MQYFKDKIESSRVLFLQETHSDSKVKQRWKEEFRGPVFFSHRKSNFCGELIAFFGTGTFVIKKQQTDKEGRIFILDVSTNDSEYILMNLYNANTEKEQIDVLSILFKLLKKFVRNPPKQLVMEGDFNLFFDSKLDAYGGNPTFNKKIFS